MDGRTQVAVAYRIERAPPESLGRSEMPHCSGNSESKHTPPGGPYVVDDYVTVQPRGFRAQRRNFDALVRGTHRASRVSPRKPSRRDVPANSLATSTSVG
eukprot:1177640-Prorocentrum_minimum.AAC.4